MFLGLESLLVAWQLKQQSGRMKSVCSALCDKIKVYTNIKLFIYILFVPKNINQGHNSVVPFFYLCHGFLNSSSDTLMTDNLIGILMISNVGQSTQNVCSPLFVPEHGPPVESNSLILDVVVDTGLCKDEHSSLVHFVFLRLDMSQQQPETQAGLRRSYLLPFLLSGAPVGPRAKFEGPANCSICTHDL